MSPNLVAVHHEPDAAAAASAALLETGFAGDNAVLCPGEDFVNHWNAYLAHRGALAPADDFFRQKNTRRLKSTPKKPGMDHPS